MTDPHDFQIGPAQTGDVDPDQDLIFRRRLSRQLPEFEPADLGHLYRRHWHD